MLAELSNWHPLKLCGHLKKNHRRSNAIVERGPFFASGCFQCLTATIQKRQPSQSDAHFARTSSSDLGVVFVAYGVRFFFHFQRMLTINHSLVQIADATASANALDTSRLARQMPNSHVTVSLFVVSDACAVVLHVVLQCGGHEQAVRMECAAWMWSKFTHKWL